MPPGYGNDNDNDDNSHSEDVDSTDFTTSWEIYFLKKKRGRRAEVRGKPKTSDCTKILEILGNMSAVIVCYPVCDVMNFEIHLSFLIKPLIKWPNIDNKNWNISRMKRDFEVKNR